MDNVWVNFAVSLGANITAGLLIAYVVYYFVDKRVQDRQKKRAYLSVYLVLLNIIARLEYLRNWLKTVPDEPSIDEMDNIPIPRSLLINPKSFVEKWRENIEGSPDMPIEFLLDVEDMILNSEEILFTIYTYTVTNRSKFYKLLPHYPELFTFYRDTIKDLLVEVHSVLAEARSHLDTYSSDDWLVKRMVEQLTNQDESHDKRVEKYPKITSDDLPSVAYEREPDIKQIMGSDARQPGRYGQRN